MRPKRRAAAELGVAQATVHYTFGTKEELYRAVMEQLTQDLVAQVERAAPTDASFEDTIATLAEALWHTVLEQPASHQLLTELSMFALRTPHLQEALHAHQRDISAVTTKLIGEAAERTGHRLAQPAETIARFFLAGFDGLTMQHLSLPDEEAEEACMRALIAAVLAMA
ncbi:TetR/AcrR family transcriptional regulator [Streptomyces cellostaticus]|nr:TetR family transcriptional regulator C-terminal domain-containing protein [Streptomyces cellostaticus]